MATVIMRWLETKPSDYDRGIELLTLGRLQPLKERIANDYIWSQGRDEVRVLEIGCGTGSLAALMALKGASVVAIDSSEVMLQEARFGATRLAIEDRVSFYHMDGTELADRFEPGSFDVIVSTLVFSEFQPEI
ncbi:MAG TPA: class I SAM-dependent methyltransferase, partial [candidate division Zixibacteria bacterium]|nr:class I SAM-dependent methyltransferase [candidate division Zixibacteria bacterium]